VEFPIPANHFFDLDAIGTNGSFANGTFFIMGNSTIDGVAIDEQGFDQDISNAISASTTWNVWYPARIDAEFKIGNESKLGSSYHANHIIAVAEQSIRLFIKPAPGSPNPTTNCEALIQGRLYSK
jgi:hypothetical protein